MDLENMKKVEVERLDVSPYVGKKVNIETVEVVKTQFGEAIKVSTELLDTIKVEGKEDILLRASRMFSVSKEGNIVIDSKIDKFMIKLGVEQPKELVGKEVQVIKNDKDFLTF